MSNKYDNTNKGVLWKNDTKKTDKHPDYSGTMNIKGEEFWLSGWKKTSKKGRAILSLSATAKKPVYNESQKLPKKEEPYNPEFTDDIPF